MAQQLEPRAELPQHQERWCVWAIYAGPALLACITVSMIITDRLNLFKIPMFSQVDDIVMIANGCLAGLIAAIGEVFRRGSVASRVASGLIYIVMGIALYTLFSMSLWFLAMHFSNGRWP